MQCMRAWRKLDCSRPPLPRRLHTGHVVLAEAWRYTKEHECEDECRLGWLSVVHTSQQKDNERGGSAHWDRSALLTLNARRSPLRHGRKGVLMHTRTGVSLRSRPKSLARIEKYPLSRSALLGQKWAGGRAGRRAGSAPGSGRGRPTLHLALNWLLQVLGAQQDPAGQALGHLELPPRLKCRVPVGALERGGADGVVVQRDGRLQTWRAREWSSWQLVSCMDWPAIAARLRSMDATALPAACTLNSCVLAKHQAQ